MAKRKAKKAAQAPSLLRNGTSVAQFGGSFAPPIDVVMKDYRKTLDTVRNVDPRAMHALRTMFAAVDEFLATDIKTAESMSHLSGIGTMTKLDGATVEKLDPLVPFPEEVNVLKNWLEAVKQAESIAYTNAVEAWKTSVCQHVAEKHFNDPAVRKVAKLTKLTLEERECLPQSVQDDLCEADKCREAAVDEFLEAMRTKSHPDIPYPERPPELFNRNAAHHLLWYTNELAEDRVPLTADKLPRV